MARNISPRCKKSRREGEDLLLTSGLRPLGSKCKADVSPGQHGAKRTRLSEYALQLRAKQKLKRIYGLLEKQFRNLYKKASGIKGSTGENLLRLLEQRLDNITYRLGFASTRAEARQLVSHGAILVNGDRVNIPSYHIKPGDVVSIRAKARSQERIQGAITLAQQREECEWINANVKNMEGSLVRLPDLLELPTTYNVNLVVELYSK